MTLLFVAVRGLLLMGAFGDLFTPGYELWPVGVIASEMLEGFPSVGVLDLHDTHSGGQFLSAAVTAGLFALLGNNFLVLKLTPLLFALGTVLVSMVFVGRRLGRGTAVLLGLLLTLTPPAWVDFSAANFGNHSEVVFFVALSLFPFARLLVDRDDTPWVRILFGLSCGVAVWYALSSLVVVLLYLAYWFCVERWFFLRRRFLPWLLGAGLGIAPLVAVLISRGAPQAQWMVAKFVERNMAGGEGLIERLVRFWFGLLPEAPCSYDLPPLRGSTLDVLLVVGWMQALVFLVFRHRDALLRCLRRVVSSRAEPPHPRDATVVLLAYPLCISLAYAGGDFMMGHWERYPWGGFRYIMTLFYVFALVSVMAVHELRRRGLPRAGNLLASGLVLTGVLGNLGHGVDLDHWGDGLSYPGANYFKLGRVLAKPRFLENPQLGWDALERLEPWRRAETYRGLGTVRALAAMRGDGWEGTDSFDPLSVLEGVPGPYRTFVARGVGTQVTEHAFTTDQPWIAERELQRLLTLDHPMAGSFLQGLFLASEPHFPAVNPEALLQLTGLLAPAASHARAFAYEGLGMHLGDVLWHGRARDRESTRALLEVLPQRIHPDDMERVWVGVGFACRGARDDPGAWLTRFEGGFPPHVLRPLLVGIGWSCGEIWQDDERWLERVPQSTAPAIVEALRTGLALAAQRRQIAETSLAEPGA